MPTENNNQQNALRIDPQALLKWFDDKWSEQECPVCHEHSWRIEETAVQLPRFILAGQQTKDSSFMPVIPVICKNCAYTILFNGFDTGALKLYRDSTDE